MVRHQAVGDDSNPGLCGRADQVFAQTFQKERVVGALKEDVLAIVASIVDVIVFAADQRCVASWHRVTLAPRFRKSSVGGRNWCWCGWLVNLLTATSKTLYCQLDCVFG